MRECQICGKTDIEIGMLAVGVGGPGISISNGTVPVIFQSQPKNNDLKSDLKSFFFGSQDNNSGMKGVYASICKNCGHIDMYADPAQLKEKD